MGLRKLWIGVVLVSVTIVLGVGLLCWKAPRTTSVTGIELPPVEELTRKSVSSGKWTLDAYVPPVLLTFEFDNRVDLQLKLCDKAGKMPAVCRVTSKLFEGRGGALLWASDEVELKLHPMLEYDMPHDVVAHMTNPYVGYSDACFREDRNRRLGEFTMDIEVLLEDGTRLRIEKLPFRVLFGPT